MASLNDIETKIQSIIDKLSIKTITGVLPLTFTAKGGTAVDWVIYGNDDVGENLINVADFTVGVDETHNVFNGKLPAGTYTAAVYQNTALTSAERNTLVILKTSGAIYESANTNYHLAAGWHYLTFTIAESENVSLRYWIVNASNSVNCTSVMLVKGSTAPDHYIPYQQGVGERTENLFDKTTAAQYRMINSSTGEAVSSYSSRCATDWIDIKQSDTISISNASVESGAFYDSSKQYISGIYSYGANKSVPSGAQYVRLTVPFDELDYFMLVKGSTVPETHIPFGYQIPITVTDSSNNSTNYTFQLGSQPLAQGQSISKTSTGVDISTAVGENTISTTLYNNPKIKIYYKWR